MVKENELILEVCADSVSGAQAAQAAGAGRIEFCVGLPEGGVTPSMAQIRAARKILHIPLYVLIRPRGGDFLYSDEEHEIMLSDVDFCGQAGCDGVVVGMLHPDGTVDAQRCRALVDAAHRHGMGVTFHRAFDRSNDLFRAMEAVIGLGCERILTSGGCDTAVEGAAAIRQLVEKAAGRIAIMPGSGVTPENAAALARATGARELHGTFRSRMESRMQHRNAQLSRQHEEYGLLTTDAEKIKKVLKSINV
ncbi:MAG: copper homeostasis protein CutC [Prevotellaceae bacterium]|jgi:copper homeostasis protein|nr:copper homeostasis protein CutC [Prevotellaceae bacterium]